jgi:hypothetical protein
MAQSLDREHVLVLYRSSERADAGLLSACERGARVTVVALARQESPRSGCCDTRSVLWNGVCRDLASEDLARAWGVVGERAGVEFHVLVAPGRDAARALASEALARGADEIVVADPRGAPLGRLERRQLRRWSAVPVSA